MWKIMLIRHSRSYCLQWKDLDLSKFNILSATYCRQSWSTSSGQLSITFVRHNTPQVWACLFNWALPIRLKIHFRNWPSKTCLCSSRGSSLSMMKNTILPRASEMALCSYFELSSLVCFSRLLRMRGIKVIKSSSNISAQTPYILICSFIC